MKLNKISKLIKKIKKNAAVKLFTILLPISPFVLNCSIPTPNEAPNTYITKEFPDDGNVKYTFSGTDEDGSVDYIKVKINNGGYQNFSNNSSVSVPIIEGNNTVEAIAYDNKGEADPTPATYSFNSPTEGQARTLIYNILKAEENITHKGLEEDVLVSLEPPPFYVDYKITKFDGTYTVVNYVEHQESLEQELLNKDVLDSWGISKLYLPRIPESEINLKLNDLIDGGYN